MVCLYCVDSVYGRMVCISSTDSVELMYEMPWPCMQNLPITLHPFNETSFYSHH
jgi:hypothetical protein